MATCLAYSIKDIASWQEELKLEEAKGKTVKLPTLQRGFVWSANQIELLWDSILRGYPIGSVLVAEGESTKELLDGQQRSTSIALGFYDPFNQPDGIEFLNAKKNAPTVWIDLESYKSNIYGAHFAIRVLTRSHPWGYQRSDNRKPLKASEKKKAFAFIKERQNVPDVCYTELPASARIPWDAYRPVPLAFLLNADTSSFEKWKKELFEKINLHLGPIKTMHSKTDENKYVDWQLSDGELRPFFEAVLLAHSLLIPEVKVNKSVLDEMNGSEVEANAEATLFVRLNNGGTQISGEELIYSMLKASFPETKQLVERTGGKFIAPSKVVNLFARMALTNRDEPRYQKELNIQNFRRNAKNEHFKNELTGYLLVIGEEDPKAKIIMDQAIKLVEGNTDELAPIYVKELIKRSTDLFYVLLLYISSKNETDRTDSFQKDHKAYHFAATFGKDHKAIAERTVPLVLKDNMMFYEAIDSIKGDSELFRMVIEPVELSRVLSERILPVYITKNVYINDEELLKAAFDEDAIVKILNQHQPITDSYSELEQKQRISNAIVRWTDLMNKLLHDRNLLIHAQRAYFNSEFKDYMEFDGINDTNRPWDWDHIYPESWVYYRPGIADCVRRSYNFNGNFRALSYDENRSENNRMSPEARFMNVLDPLEDYDPLHARKISFIHVEDVNSDGIGYRCNDLVHWQMIDRTANTLKNGDPRTNDLIIAIFKRMVNIYAAWYDSFGHPFVIPSSVSVVEDPLDNNEQNS